MHITSSSYNILLLKYYKKDFCAFLCLIFKFLSEKQAFSGLHVHGKSGFGIVQGAVSQDGAAVGQ